MLNISRLDVAARQRLEEELQAMPSDFAREAAKALLLETLEYGMPISAAQLAAPPGYERTPVSMAQFLDDPEYMGGMENLRPVVRQDLIDCFAGDYTEVVIAGGIGTGKSTWVSFAYSYMIYLLSCLADPAKYYGLIPGTTVYLVNQSINLDLAKKVLFGEIKARIRESPYFQKYYPPDKSVTGELHFPKNIKVLPLACQDTSALGLNVFGGCFPGDAQFLSADGDLVRFRDACGIPLQVPTRPQSMFRNIRLSPETRVVATGFKQLIRLTLDNGAAIICTPDQQFKDIYGRWVIADESTGRHLRFTDMRAMQKAGWLSVRASKESPQDGEPGLSNEVSRRAADWSTADRVSTERQPRSGSDSVCNLRSELFADHGETSKVSRDDGSGIPQAISRSRLENRFGKESVFRESSPACSASTPRSEIQGKPAAWHDEVWRVRPREDAPVKREPILSTGHQSEGQGMVGRTEFSGEVQAHQEISGRALSIQGSPRSVAHDEIEDGSRDCVLARHSNDPLGLRDGAVEVPEGYGRARLCSRFCADRLLLGSQGVDVSLEQENTSHGSAGSAVICDNGEGCGSDRTEDGSPLADAEVQKVRFHFITENTGTFPGARCVSVEAVDRSELCYDVENAGPSHSFFVEAGHGFLEAKNCLDEVNFYPIVARSKKVRSVSEVYDAAERMYTAIARRLKSRFMAGFKVPGKIMMVSQTQYDEDFTERKILEARTNPLIFVRRRALWESKTEGWCGETFQIQVGGKLSRPRILTGNESQDELIDGEVVNVPIEFRPDFDRDIVGATRDIAGRPTSAAHPFISDIAKLRTCIDSGREHPFSGFETNLRDGVRLLAEKLAVQGEDGTWKPKFYPKALRYAHIDYALTNDECGLAVGCGPEMRTVQRRDVNSGMLMDVSAPIIHMDLMLKIIPPKGGEIDLADVRGIIYSLRDLGFWVRQCNFDQFMSAEGQQEFRKHGIKSETLSVDTDMSPYLTTREAVYEARLRTYEYLPFETEMAFLEIDRVRGKVDHPPGKDKGITDAVASVCEQVTQASGGQLGVLDYMREQQDEWDRKKKGSILQKPMTSDKTEKCPKCGSMAIQQMPGFRRCGQCGEQFGGAASSLGSPSRKDFTK